MIESFWGRVQTELLNRHRWRTRLELAGSVRCASKTGVLTLADWPRAK